MIAKNAEKSLKQLLDNITENSKLANVEAAIEENENEGDKEQENNDKNVEGDYELEQTLISME